MLIIGSILCVNGKPFKMSNRKPTPHYNAPRVGHMYMYFHEGAKKPFERVLFYDHFSARDHKRKIRADYVYILPSDYNVSHEIINIETGEYMEYHI